MTRAWHRLGVRFTTVLGLLLAVSQPRAEELVVALSTREVAITSTYTGADITIFGMIERDARTIARSGAYDVVANVQGPMGDIVVQQKSQMGPIWLTAGRRRFAKVPMFFSVLSARPLAEITNDETRKRLKLGLEYHLPEMVGLGTEMIEEQGFRAALLRLRTSEQAVHLDEKAITMVRPNLFTAHIALPATAPIGLYLVNISVLSEGVPLKTVQAGFVVRKVGFDAFVANAARSDAWLYALVSIVMAVSLGWLANLIFRRD